MRVAVYAMSAFLALSLCAASPGRAEAVLCARVEAMAVTDPIEGLNFDHKEHRLWYRRFWTGNCKGLSFFQCFSGKPYWCDSLGTVIDRTAPQARLALARRMVALGRLIGHEWARDNDIRKIHTSDIKAWYRELEKPASLTSSLDRIEAAARAKLGLR